MTTATTLTPPVTSRRRPLILFLSVWLIYAAFTNSSDARNHNLQHAGVEALVERHTMYVDGSSSERFQKIGDAFWYDGRLYPLKAPGQFLAGAAAYYPIHWFIRYTKSHDLAAYLVTIFSAGIFGAAAVTALFLGVERLTGSGAAALGSSVAFGFGTNFFPYTGVLFHDVFATSCAAMSWSAIVISMKARRPLSWIAVSGVLGGLAITMSLLTPLLVLALVPYVDWKTGLRRTPVWLIGFVVGLAPMLIVHTIYFGSPLRLPHQVAGVADVMPDETSGNILTKLGFYFVWPQRSLFFHSPICLIALLGLGFLAREHAKEFGLILISGAYLLAYLCAIHTVGHAQYGPRYLMPWMPFLCLGLIPFWTRTHVLGAPAWTLRRYVVMPILGISISLNLMGAITTVMRADLTINSSYEAFVDIFGSG
jgi:hypothetical protein